jgi:hypothetical protein
MVHQLLASLPRAAIVAITTVAIVGASVAAAASVGEGGEAPAPVTAMFSALGFGVEHSHGNATATPGAGKGKAARAAATGTTVPGRDLPSSSSITGLCRAYLSGSENGREHKLQAPAFKRLQNAADAAGAASVDSYCSGRSATPTPTPGATVSAGATQGALPLGGNANARGHSEEHRKSYSPAAILAGSTPATKGNSEDHAHPSAPVAGSSGVAPKGKANR